MSKYIMKSIAKTLLITALLASSTSAFAEAGDMWLNFHIGSSHSGEGYYKYEDNDGEKTPYYEDNYGIGIEYETGSTLSLKAGTYRNSTNNQTIYGGINLHTSYENTFGIGLNLGLATGYEDQYGSSILPMAMPTLNIIIGDARAEISYLPGIGRMDSIASLTIGWRF